MRKLFALCLWLALAGCSPTDDSGILTRLPDADGRWLVINYWAIWCAPCREEIPELNDFAASHADTVDVLAVNFDNRQGEELLADAAELDIRFGLLGYDPAAQIGYARPTVLPTTMIINPEGVVWARLLGPQTEAQIAAAIEAGPQKAAPPIN